MDGTLESTVEKSAVASVWGYCKVT